MQVSFSRSCAFFFSLAIVLVGCASGGGSEPQGGNSGTGGAVATGGGGGKASGGGAGAGAARTGGATGTGGTIVSGTPRGDCQAPARYRNLFIELLGKSQADVDAKLDRLVKQLFHGTGDQPIYYELGTDQAYILDVGNNDVRSEGVSYGMTVAVEMDMKAEFDKLWTFAARRMRQPSGLFAWQLDTSGGIISPYAAPDGDEYIAMALLLASRRWGDATGTNYADEAKKVLRAMATQGDFNRNPAVVTFGPTQGFSDPSYVLPLFYSEWACFDSANADLWKAATTYARTFFQKTTHATTGLAPERANFDGSPRPDMYGNYGSDAIRVPMNVMMDFNLNNADPWQSTYAQRNAAFWLKEGLSGYGEAYTLVGVRQGSGGHGAGAAGVNAMLAFALPEADAKKFLQAVWEAPIPTGQWRYYEGCLYMLSMLHLSGKFDLFYK